MLLSVFVLGGSVSGVLGQETSGLLDLIKSGLPTNRLTIAVVPLENATGASESEHWRVSASTLLVQELGQAKGLRVLPQTSIRYGLNQLHKKPGEHLDVREAATLGECIEARRVLWGSYRREGFKWQIRLRSLNTSDGATSKEISASSSDWFVLREALAQKLLKELGVKTTRSERRKMNARWTRSAEALECLSRAAAAAEDKRPAAESETWARRAVDADPECAEALTALATTMALQGKVDEALARLRHALSLKPDLGMAWSTLGHALMLTQRVDEAEQPLTKAVCLDPDNPTRLGRLAEYYLLEKKPAEAVELFQEALRLGPFQASLHANLARAYLLLAKREAALEQMHLAEVLSYEPDLNTEEYLSWGYSRLNETAAALAHYEKALGYARQLGLSPDRVKLLEDEMAALKAASNPVSVTVAEPKHYDEQAWRALLQERLSAAEQALLITPLATSPEMSAQAMRVAEPGTNDLHKARLLFETLVGHLDPGEGLMRTAPEVFAAWNSPEASFTCQEYALLYTEMARAAGLRAYVASVEQDYHGENVSHACAAVFTGDKAWLVDPTYHWFGVPHKRFNVMSDPEATADYLCQLSDLRRRQIAVKLAPDSVYAHFKLGSKYVVEEQWPEARQELAVLERLQENAARTYFLKALLALHEKKLDETVELATKALAQGWPANDGFVHFILGRVYYEQGRLSDSREAFRIILRRAPDEQGAKVARRCIARINEILSDE